MITDPLSGLQIDAESFDIDRIASVYYNRTGTRCWTKAWFNKKEEGERAVEVSVQLADQFRCGRIPKDDWLARFYPKQMSACSKAIEQARNMMLGI